MKGISEMKCNRQKKLGRFYSFAFNLVLLFANAVQAQTTAFTYQGRLTDAGNPANGNYDLQFKLFDMLAGGTQQGATLTRTPVAVSLGAFSVTLDFGANVFTGANRYLEIGVRPAGSANPYTALAPRQSLTSSPYAIQTLNAQQLGGVDASQYVTTTNSGTSFILNSSTQQASANFNISGNGAIGGNLGVGITSPLGRLHAHSGGATSHLVLSTGSGSEGPARFRLQADSGLVGQGRSFVIYDDLAAQYRMLINGNGNIGVGLTNPTAKLHVMATGNNNTGIRADSQGNAIIGVSTTPGFAALYGENTTSGSFGLYGKAGSSGTGVHGEGSPGVVGANATENGIGVFARSTGSTGTGVRGEGYIGVYGIQLGAGFAGYFQGDVSVSDDFSVNDLADLRGNVNVHGNLAVIGDKNFVEPHPTDPNKMIKYVALEGPEAGTFFRGSARIVNGVAIIQVPEDFRLVTDEKGLTIQVTPLGAPATIWCVKKSLDQIELRGSADVEFDYLVNGVRRLSKDHQPIVENTLFVPHSAEDKMFKNLKPEALRRLKDTGILHEDGTVNMETVKKLDAYQRRLKQEQ
jgi:hypothetical protein